MVRRHEDGFGVTEMAQQPVQKEVHVGKHAKKAFVALYILMGVLALVLAAGVIYFVVETGKEAVGIAAQDDEAAREKQKEEAITTTPSAKAIDLVALLGLDGEDAVGKIGHGAYIESDRNISEDGFSRQLTVPLANEKGTDRSGTPTVTLYLDSDGKVGRASYTASFSAVGFKGIALDEAVGSANLVPAVLTASGLDEVDASGIVLPEDRSAFSTYESDGTTLTAEEVSFKGTGSADGEEYSWQSTLSYDYGEANAQGNLAYTVRTVSVSIEQA